MKNEPKLSLLCPQCKMVIMSDMSEDQVYTLVGAKNAAKKFATLHHCSRDFDKEVLIEGKGATDLGGIIVLSSKVALLCVETGGSR